MKEFLEAVARAAETAGLPFGEALAHATVPKERDRADLSLPCFPFARAQKRAPPQIAAAVAKAFAPGDLLEAAEAAGPFVNFRVNRAEWTRRILGRVAREGADFGGSESGRGRTVVIDYGSPNIAKPLLFHHLRSSVIGQALCNLHRRLGWKVIGLNFLGDVGTAFGKLMAGIERHGEAKDAAELNALYVKASAECAADPALMARAREWAKRLEDGDPEATRYWTRAREISLEGFRRVYDLLGVKHDVVEGEQMYVAPANALIARLEKEGRARLSDGAIVLDPKDASLGVLLLRKSDGATLYQTRDLAAILDRFDRFRFERMLYVVDIAQELHFRQLFSGLDALGHPAAGRCRHVMFGQVLMGGRRAKTREGRGVLLEEVLDEGMRRAKEIVAEKNPDLAARDRVARAVGVAAVIFSDLGSQIRRDIDFDWEEILSFDGRTGPYLQYAHASACSILRKGEGPREGDPALLRHPLEWELSRRLAEYPAAVERSCEECEPSVLADHLYELAREFRGWHAAGGKDRELRVLCEDPALRAARLRLVDAVRTTLRNGLTLLGIDPVEEM
jgi:arginyl-tRNA synthetase